MPTNHDVTSAVPPTGGAAVNKTNLRNLLVARMAYVMTADDNPQDFIETDPSTGAVVQVIIYLGRNFELDPADTTTAHDGTTCLVTDGGKRYKLVEGQDVFAWSVLDKDLIAPPDGETQESGSAATSTGNPGTTTYVDRSWQINNSETVYKIGLYATTAGARTLKIVKRNSAGNYDVIMAGPVVHDGAGWQDFVLSPPVEIPASGDYFAAVYTAINPTDFGPAVARAWTGSDVTGSGQSLTEDTDLVPPIRVTYGLPLPTIGDAYLVPTGATGDWASHDDEIAVFTARDWEFLVFGIGRQIYVEDEDKHYHRDSNGNWVVDGVSAGSIPASAMVGSGGRLTFIVENQTTNTPPAITEGVNYVIGSSPTGRWTGQAGKIAAGENGGETIYTPSAGWKIFDKLEVGLFYYSGSAWESLFGRLKLTPRSIASSSTWSKPSRLAYIVSHVYGGGGGGGDAGTGADGGTTSFGSHHLAQGGNRSDGTGGGSGSGGNVNLTGLGVTCPGPFGAKAAGVPGQGFGGGGLDGGGEYGFGGGYSMKVINAADLGSSESVTVGGGGAAGTGGQAGQDGFVFIEEYTYE